MDKTNAWDVQHCLNSPIGPIVNWWRILPINSGSMVPQTNLWFPTELLRECFHRKRPAQKARGLPTRCYILGKGARYVLCRTSVSSSFFLQINVSSTTTSAIIWFYGEAKVGTHWEKCVVVASCFLLLTTCSFLLIWIRSYNGSLADPAGPGPVLDRIWQTETGGWRRHSETSIHSKQIVHTNYGIRRVKGDNPALRLHFCSIFQVG